MPDEKSKILAKHWQDIWPNSTQIPWVAHISGRLPATLPALFQVEIPVECWQQIWWYSRPECQPEYSGIPEVFRVAFLSEFCLKSSRITIEFWQALAISHSVRQQ